MLRSTELKKVAWLSFYGFMLLWSPFFGTSEALIFPRLSSYPDLLLASRVANIAAFGIVMGVVAIAGERGKKWLSGGALVPAAVALGALGMLGGALVGLQVLPADLLAPAGFLRGVFYGLLTVVWINMLIQLRANVAASSIAAALVLYAAVGWAVVLASDAAPAAAAALLTACPVLSFVGCAQGQKSFSPETPIAEENDEVPPRTRCALYVSNFLFAAMLGVVLCYFAFYDTMASIAAFTAASAALFAVFFAVSDSVTPHHVYRMFLMLFAVVAPCTVLFGGRTQVPAELVASAALAVIVLYTFIIFMDTQARMRRPFWRIPGTCQVFAALGFAAGSAGFYIICPDGNIDGEALLLLVASCVAFVASVFSPSHNQQVRPWGFSSLTPKESPAVHAMRRCGELAERGGLTSRELEILQMLASGSSNADIAQVLVISPATVKTHVRNIYAKLSVHSRSELEALITEL